MSKNPLMYNALIIDDESKLREVLKIKLEKYCPSINVIGEAENISDAQIILDSSEVDLIFLDIAMPGGTGFDFIEQQKEIDFEIIFITGFNEYALDALRVSAVDYLLKPLRTEVLIEAVNKAIEKIHQLEKVKKYEVLKHNINHIGDQSTKIAIPGSEYFEFVVVSDIIRLEGWNKYTKIILSSGKTIVSSYNVGTYKDMLENYGFYPCHKSHVINKTHIKKYHKEGFIVMSDKSEVPLARRRKEEFLTDVLSGVIIR